jgi:uroporphyrinogen III methyltransferase/synthase
VLLARAREQAPESVALLEAAGAEAVIVPAIEIHPPSDPGPLRQALADLRAGRYGWVAFTSANGVERAWQELVEAGGDASAFAGARVAVVGPATARALEAHGVRVDVVAKEFRGERLADAMLAAIGEAGGGPPRVLLAVAAGARAALPGALSAAGCTVDVVVAYETRKPPAEVGQALARDLEQGRIDAVLFTSSSTVDNMCDLLGARAVALLSRTRVAVIGPVTRDSAVQRGLRVDVMPPAYSLPALVAALADSYGQGTG